MKTAVQDTSINSYRNLAHKEDQTDALRKTYEKYGNCTDREIEFYTGIRANTVSARRNEMPDVVECAKRKCKVTGRMVISWKLHDTLGF